MLFDERVPLKKKILKKKGEMNNKKVKDSNSLIIVCLCESAFFPSFYFPNFPQTDLNSFPIVSCLFL